MKKGVKLDCYNQEELKSYFVCSECFFFVGRHHKYCHQCGALFDKGVVQSTSIEGSSGFDYVVSIRKRFIEGKDEE